MMNRLMISKEVREVAEFWFKILAGLFGGFLAVAGFHTALGEFRSATARKIFEDQISACRAASRIAEEMNNADDAHFEAKLHAFGEIKHGELTFLVDQATLEQATNLWNAGAHGKRDQIAQLVIDFSESCRNLLTREIDKGLEFSQVAHVTYDAAPQATQEGKASGAQMQGAAP
jgi:hypothetical protein